MCGIVGFGFPESPSAVTPLLKDGNEAPCYRGRANSGTLVRDGIVLGHSRITISDLGVSSDSIACVPLVCV
jgi:hypothetical protein